MEWTIIEGILEGAMIARLLLQSLRRVLNVENMLRFQRTIVAQVEGELVAQLLDRTPMYSDHQTSDRLVEAIMMAARA